MAINVYEQAQDLYNEFEPKTLVKLQYKPTERSRKWRDSSLTCRYVSFEHSTERAAELQIWNDWHATRWIKA